MIRRLWRTFWSPTGVVSIGVLIIAGFAGGVIFWGGLNTAVDYTNKLEFCVSCHEMRDTVYQEYKKSPHFRNASGVGAICSDCHVAKKLVPKMIDKVKASRELYHTLLGTIATPEKFEAHRAEMAQRVWAEMKNNDSRECRSCHIADHMDFTLQDPKAAKLMKAGFERGETCIDCHKGIAHKLPDLSQGFRSKFVDLEAMARKRDTSDNDLYVLKTIPFYSTAKDAAAGENRIGQVLAATHLSVQDRASGALKVKVEGWQQDGVAQVVYALRGQRIFEAVIKKKAVAILQTLSTETDPDTDLVWHQVSFEGWVAPGELIGNVAPIWEYTAQMYDASCGICHTAPDPGHYLANQWIGTLKSMKRFITLDKEEYRVLQKYLQLNAKDTGGAADHG